MPLNPNGKIDKPALPFPDTVQAITSAPVTVNQASPTEQAMSAIWANLLPNCPQPVPLDESFFDLGGHSILATRLIFEIRKVFVIDAPLGLIFEKPTIFELVQSVELLRNSDLGLTFKDQPLISNDHLSVPGAVPPPKQAVEYGNDYLALLGQIQPSFSPLPADFGTKPLTVFLTGATGFLGAFVLRCLLSQSNVKKVICLVRATDSTKALDRLKETMTDRGIWDDAWISAHRIEAVKGDLNLVQFGLEENWNSIANEADVVLHNGAFVSIIIVTTLCA